VPLYAVSDLHLDEDDGSRLFEDSRQGARLVELLAQLKREPGAELVLLGDVFDFTSMLAPERGLERFARRLGFPPPSAEPRSTLELAKAAARSNPHTIRALGDAARELPMTLVPGNHDRHLAGPDARAALDAIGLEAVKLEPFVTRELAGRRLVMQHGHLFDEGNATPHGGGEVMTRVMHRAVIPFLQHHGPRAHVSMDVDRVASMRPAESVVPMLRRWLTEPDFRRFFDAFLELLADNGYLKPPVSWFRFLITPERVRRRIQAQEKVWEDAADRGLATLRGDEPLPQGGPRPDVLVLGHTHVPDWAVHDCPGRENLLYVNLGTWTERANDANSPLDTSMPMLRLAEEDGALAVRFVDFQKEPIELQRMVAKAR
jgi:UDP-2,3-diacylglucosamine pyrophosphatase LpxH